jgi:hypothetical protein
MPPRPSLAACHLVPLASHEAQGSAGRLVPVEAGAPVPFAIQRVFCVSGMQAGSRRGGHANTATTELLICLHGAVEVVLSDGDGTTSFRLDRPDEGLLITPGIWVEERGAANDTVLVVLADTSWAVACDAYVRDRTEWHRRLITTYAVA